MSTKPDEKNQQGDQKNPEHKPNDPVHMALLTDAEQTANLNLAISGLTKAEKQASASKAEPVKTAPDKTELVKTESEKAEPAAVNSQAMLRASKVQVTLSDEQINDILYKGLSSARNLLTTTRQDLLSGKDYKLVNEEECKAIKAENLADTEAVCQATPNNSGHFALSFARGPNLTQATSSETPQSKEGPLEVTPTNIQEANTALESFAWHTKAWQEYKVKEKDLDKTAGVERLPGGGYLRRDANGREVFRKEGGLATTTAADGRKYIYNTKTQETSVVDKEGREVMRRLADGSIEFIHADGSFIRRNGQFIETHGKDGVLGSVISIDAQGQVSEIDIRKYTKIQRQRLGLFDAVKPAVESVFSAFDKALSAQKIGVTVAGDATITTDQSSQSLISSNNGKGAYVLVDKDNIMYRDGLGRMEILLRNGQKVAIPPQKVAELWVKYGAAMKALIEASKGVQRILTRRGLLEVRNDDHGRTTVTGPEGEKVEHTDDGRVKIEDGTGHTTYIKPDGTGSIASSSGEELKIKPGGKLSFQGLDVDARGKITDTNNGTVIDDKGIKTAEGTNYDFASGHVRFGDGVELGSHGEVLNCGSGKDSLSAQGEAGALAAQANSMAAKAEAIASSLSGKAASGRLTAADVAMLQATLGGLERSLKMLDNETDMTSLVRLMMSKGTVEESLGKVEKTPKVA